MVLYKNKNEELGMYKEYEIDWAQLRTADNENPQILPGKIWTMLHADKDEKYAAYGMQVRYLQKPDDGRRHDEAQYNGPCRTVNNCFFLHVAGQAFTGHADDNRIITAQG